MEDRKLLRLSREAYLCVASISHKNKSYIFGLWEIAIERIFVVVSGAYD